MPETTHPGEHHRHPVVVGGLDHVLVVDRAAGLDHGVDTGLGGGVDPVREREEGIRGHDRTFGCFAFGVALGLLGGEFDGVDAGDLPHTEANSFGAGREGDPVGFDVFEGLPRKRHRFQLVVGRLAFGDDLEIVDCGRGQVALLYHPAPDDGFLGHRFADLAEFTHVEHAEILLFGQHVEGGIGVAGRDDDFLEGVDNLFGGFGVTLAVERDNAAERALWVGAECAVVGVSQ